MINCEKSDNEYNLDLSPLKSVKSPKSEESSIVFNSAVLKAKHVSCTQNESNYSRGQSEER